MDLTMRYAAYEKAAASYEDLKQEEKAEKEKCHTRKCP